jgi:hypothetical protein
MRSSSIKSLVAVLSVSFTVVLAVPRAEARTSQPQRVSQVAQTQAGPIDRIQRSVVQLIQRVFSIRTNGDLPSDPLPAKFTSGTPLEPKKQR